MSWIKVDTTLIDKPEVRKVSRLVKLDRYAITGRLVALWSWCDTHTEDGTTMLTREDVDEICAKRGIADALIAVGWLAVNDDGEIAVVDFASHNGTTAKRRAEVARNVARHAAAKKSARQATDQQLTEKGVKTNQGTISERLNHDYLEKEKENKEETVLGRVIPQSVLAADAEPFPATPQEIMDFAASLPLADRPKSFYALERSCLAFQDWLADPLNRRKVADWRRKLKSWLKQDALKEAEYHANKTPGPNRRDANAGRRYE